MPDLSCTGVIHITEAIGYLQMLTETFASEKGKTVKSMDSMYAFGRLCIAVHVTSHVFNLFAVVNVFLGNKIMKTIFNQHSEKGKGFLNTHHFSKETKLCLFNINNTLRSVLPDKLFQAIYFRCERAL